MEGALVIAGQRKERLETLGSNASPVCAPPLGSRLRAPSSASIQGAAGGLEIDIIQAGAALGERENTADRRASWRPQRFQSPWHGLNNEIERMALGQVTHTWRTPGSRFQHLTTVQLSGALAEFPTRRVNPIAPQGALQSWWAFPLQSPVHHRMIASDRRGHRFLRGSGLPQQAPWCPDRGAGATPARSPARFDVQGRRGFIEAPHSWIVK